MTRPTSSRLIKRTEGHRPLDVYAKFINILNFLDTRADVKFRSSVARPTVGRGDKQWQYILHGLCHMSYDCRRDSVPTRCMENCEQIYQPK